MLILDCWGFGYIECEYCNGTGYDNYKRICDNCDGSGEDVCKYCNGSGLDEYLDFFNDE